MEKLAKEKGFESLQAMIKYYSKVLSYENEGNIYKILQELLK